NMARGNDILITYAVDGVEKRVRVINTETPANYTDATGQQVIGFDFSTGPASLASALTAMIPGLAFSSTGPNNLRILDDGVAGRTDVRTAVARSTSTGLQGTGLGFNLFIDQGNTPFTNNLDTDPPQKQ